MQSSSSFDLSRVSAPQEYIIIFRLELSVFFLFVFGALSNKVDLAGTSRVVSSVEGVWGESGTFHF